jgi:hypothetical protein
LPGGASGIPLELEEEDDDPPDEEDDDGAPGDAEPLDVSSSRPTIGAAGMLSSATGSNSSVDAAPEHALA